MAEKKTDKKEKKKRHKRLPMIAKEMACFEAQT